MELVWETDHDDHVSTSAGTENVSIGNVFEMEGRCGGMLLLPCLWFAELQKLNVCPGSWLLGVASSYLLKMMTQQAAAAWAAAKEGLQVSEFLGASAALALLGMHVKQIRHATASTAAANDGWYEPESLVASVAGSLKRHAIKKAQQAAAASAAATVIFPCVIVVVYRVFAFRWTLLELVFCILGVAAVVCWFGDAGFEFLRSWSGSGKWMKPSALSGKEKNDGDPFLRASTLAEAYECISFKGKDRHDTDGSLSLGSREASGRLDVPVSVVVKTREWMGTQWFAGYMSTLLWVTCWIARRMCGSRTTGSWFNLGDTIGHIVIGTHDTLRCGGRLRGGAQRYRSQPVDIPGQWTCQACGQEQVWPVKTHCFRCGCPKGHVPPQPESFLAGPLGRLSQRIAPTNPTYRPQRQNSKPVHPNGATQNFTPWNQPLPVGLVDAAASGSVPAFPAGNLDWLVAFLRQIMSPQDYEKYKSSFEPSPAKEEVPLAVQLANKTKERDTVMGRIEHYRNVCRDLESKLMKQSELLEEAVERKATLHAERDQRACGANCGGGIPSSSGCCLVWTSAPAVQVAFLHSSSGRKLVGCADGKRSPLILGLVLATSCRLQRRR